MAASRPHPNAPSLADLPDDALVACFAQLDDPLERRRLLPLVSRRWRQLAEDPRLLHSFRLHFKGAGSLPRLAAFCDWLEQSAAGAAVRSLRLKASAYSLAEPHVHAFSAADLQQLRNSLLRITAACSGLRELRIHTGPGVHVPPIELGSLVATLPRLRVLHLELEDAALLAEAPLGAMSQLRLLELQGNPVWLHASAVLPPALTRLSVGGFCEEHDALPPQVCNLPQLEFLNLCGLGFEPDGFNPLSLLTRLTALSLSYAKHLPEPAVLSALPNLRSLCLDECCAENAAVEEVEAALGALTQLEALKLDEMTIPLPQAVGQLPRLQRLACAPGTRGQLPDGLWLASLRQLVLPSHMAAGRIELLQQAPQLDYLGLYGRFCANEAQEYERAAAASSVLEFACQHTSLRCLQLCDPEGISEAAAAGAEQRAAHLSVSFVNRCHTLLDAVVPEFAIEYYD